MMKRSGIRRTAAIIFVFVIRCCAAAGVFAADFLDPDQAFRLSAELKNARSIQLYWDIAKGYKLYRDQVKISAEGGNVRLQEPLLPDGLKVVDPSTNESIEIFHDNLNVEVHVVEAAGVFTLNVEYQGCAEDGLCYPPITRSYRVDPKQSGILTFVNSQDGFSGSDSTAAGAEPSALSGPSSETNTADNELSLAQATLQGGSLWKISLAFIVFGVLLSFTPCVLPMVPILSSIIVGEEKVKRRRSFLMAVAYCLGMALVYTSLGVAAGLAGEGLAGALQKPWVLVTFSVLLLLLALSMFDVYQLQMPASIQNTLNKTSGKLRGGRFAGVFLMGALSALVVGPCVAAPLAGTLVYISQTRNVLIGGLALFSMATGMSVPLLLIGLSAGSILPKAGAWMIGVKYIFGLLLIAVAVWMVSPVMPGRAVMLAWGSFAILCAVFLGVFDALTEKTTIAGKFRKAFGLVLFLLGVIELVGAASGGTSVLEPLSHIQASSADGYGEGKKINFMRIRSSEELDRVLQSAKKPVMLDFYADWCVACKEMEQLTFSDPKVQEELENMTLLQVDVTANSEEDRILMKRFGLFGPPGIIIFDKTGKEIPESRIVGVMEASVFLDHISRSLTSGSQASL